jgi:hypothetical protein
MTVNKVLSLRNLIIMVIATCFRTEVVQDLVWIRLTVCSSHSSHVHNLVRTIDDR